MLLSIDKKILFLFTGLFYLYLPSFSQDNQSILGNWSCQTAYEKYTLFFKTENILVFNGESSNYQLFQNVIRIQEDYYYVDYPYRLAGDKLTIRFPEGYDLEFVKSANNPIDSPPGNPGNPAGFTQGAGNRYLLGNLCEYGGSSSYSSSYSRTTWIYFDGQGRCKYGTESSFSGTSGSLYSNDNSDQNTGTYSISSNQVSVSFPGGTNATFTVHIVQDNGQNTEMMLGERHFASGLCE